MRSANAIALIHPYAPANYVVACQFQSEKTFAFTRVRWLLISTTLAEHKMTKGFALTFAVLRDSTKDDDSRIIQWSLFGLKQVKCGSIFHIRMLNTHSLCQQLACELSWFSHSPPFWCDSIQHTSIKPNGLQQTKQWWTEFERFSIKVERCYIRFVDRGLLIRVLLSQCQYHETWNASVSIGDNWPILTISCLNELSTLQHHTSSFARHSKVFCFRSFSCCLDWNFKFPVYVWNTL